jgi:drug/metabolite transporter (DMT)-like permease
VLVNAFGNLFTRAGQAAGADIILSTGAAMLYGTGALVLFGLATHVNFAIPMTVSYIGPLLYLSVLGSVAGFVFYYRLARSAGFTTASYIGAMTPLIAMLVSTVMEHVEWTKAAFAGVVLILVGQALVLRNSNPKA